MLYELIAKLQEWLLVAGGADRLRKLDDRLLADIGVERARIDAFVRGRLLPAEEPVKAPAPAVTLGSPHPRVPRRRQVEAPRLVDAFAPRADRRSSVGK